jgi:NAD(P)-dependent dehydrogenase (short-subunit alcohol dehydrogenase family)
VNDRRAPVAPLAGRVVLVFGATRGIGRATAIGAAGAGARLSVVARSERDVDALARGLTASGAPAIAIAADGRVAAQVESAVAATMQRYGRIDVVVHSAGVGYWELVGDMSEEHWDETFAANLKSAFVLTRAVLPAMRRQQDGQIIYVGSRIALEPIPRYAAYAASKAGLRAFAEVVARETQGHGIRVTTVVPGLVDTTFSDAPYGRPRSERPSPHLMLSADEVAAQILHVIASPSNAWLKEVLVYPARL